MAILQNCESKGNAMLVILLVLVIALAGLFFYAASQPDTFTVSRTATINAAPEKIFPFLNDFNMWGRWSPYEKLDPAMRRAIAGASSGVGAAYAWAPWTKCRFSVKAWPRLASSAAVVWAPPAACSMATSAGSSRASMSTRAFATSMTVSARAAMLAKTARQTMMTMRNIPAMARSL
jgi:hypothetical protein